MRNEWNNKASCGMDDWKDINRNDFGTSTVRALIQSNSLNKTEALYLLEEALHVIISLRQRIERKGGKR